MEYWPGLDGVRALAVVAVLAYHDGRISGGFLGVSAFFTLSGFLITWLLLAEREATGRVRLRAFFARRIRRLFPAALAGIALAAVVTPMVAGAGGATAFRGDGFAAMANVANWRFLLDGRSYADLFATPSTVLHYWSLAVEEQFYLVLAPVIAGLLALGRGNRRVLAAGIVVLGAVSFLLGLRAVAGGSIDRAYYGTDTRALEFFVGALLAVVYGGRVLPRVVSSATAAAGPLALGLLVWATFHAHETDVSLFRGGLLVHALLTGIVLVAACEPGPVRALCSLAPFRALGRVSYGVYVFHWPLFLLFDDTLVRVGATLVVATVSYKFVERPIREQRPLVPRSWTLAPAGAIAVAAIVVIAAARTSPPEITYEPATSSASLATTDDVELAPAASPVAPDAAGTTVPTGPAGKRLLLVGDSVALTLGRGIERWGAANGVAVLNGGALGCTLMYDAHVRGYWGVDRRPDDPCKTRENWAGELERFEPDAVVVLYGAWDVYDASWDGGDTWHAPGEAEWNRRYAASVEDAATRLSATGADVLWLGSPCFATKPGEKDADADWYDPARPAVLREIALTVATRTGMTVSPTLAERECPDVDLEGRPDGVHFSDPGADAAATALDPELRVLLTG